MPRFPYALLGALTLHGLALLVRAPHLPGAASAIDNTRPAEQSIELDEFPIEEARFEQPSGGMPQPSEPQPVAASSPHSHIHVAIPKSTSADLEPTKELATAESVPVAAAATGTPVAADSSTTGDSPPAHKIDLGLDGHFFLHDPGLGRASAPVPAAAAELGPRARKSTAQRRLEAALSADDVQRGLARGNALVGPLRTAMRNDGPLRGEAVFQATVAADGRFESVELLGGVGAEWSAVLNAFRRLAAGKLVRVPPGAKGLRVTFSVKAKVQRPSGKEVSDTSVHVDTPSATGAGLGSSGDFDLADLGGAAQRFVYARVVAEEVL